MAEPQDRYRARRAARYWSVLALEVSCMFSLRLVEYDLLACTLIMRRRRWTSTSAEKLDSTADVRYTFKACTPLLS